jgi:hypothetical protein
MHRTALSGARTLDIAPASQLEGLPQAASNCQ